MKVRMCPKCCRRILNENGFFEWHYKNCEGDGLKIPEFMEKLLGMK